MLFIFMLFSFLNTCRTLFLEFIVLLFKGSPFCLSQMSIMGIIISDLTLARSHLCGLKHKSL